MDTALGTTERFQNVFKTSYWHWCVGLWWEKKREKKTCIMHFFF